MRSADTTPSAKDQDRILKLLLDDGADFNALHEYYGGALQMASVEGHERTVKLLLDKRAGVKALGGYRGSVL